MAKVWPYPIKAAVFDCDGVLLDTIPIYRKVNSIIIGEEYPDWLFNLNNGRTDIESCRNIINHYKLNLTPEEMVKLRFQYLDKMFPECSLVPGVERIVKTLKQIGLKLGIATSSLRHDYENKIQNHRDFEKYFDYILCGDEVSHAKPDPEIFQKAAAHICDFPPENVLVFEDAASGIKAANSANMPSVLLWRQTVKPDESLNKLEAKPTLIINSFDDFNFESFDFETK
ncbi:haloacid dehalogenase-like hydrolase family protein [Trichomonas vaginalis G3]|uniref:Haloacid dehalogenase-like hydrolase family protein n=1 Tax=Trichomonas vaginalis (strain ATCC PRA-98 / G3) TaxID=412133 RepID=A2EVG6_TRIV3|nr:pseudouridine 5'-phosphatase protein [Trichomonas vaginalis G3]EAY03352.1 haloacid dehalogenase-like hydrolase family protein [Trichomonas vaginalis G3]KAI5518827.1 pseudouridine 5'-phosphatase protein [Trichomonas vaginalis G3]|eukprot:XP_001315575.1 haloacid dehalogenase-like hydrolase family protein [Trichomonas vaginalis G3]